MNLSRDATNHLHKNSAKSAIRICFTSSKFQTPAEYPQTLKVPFFTFQNLAVWSFQLTTYFSKSELKIALEYEPGQFISLQLLVATPTPFNQWVNELAKQFENKLQNNEFSNWSQIKCESGIDAIYCLTPTADQQQTNISDLIACWSIDNDDSRQLYVLGDQQSIAEIPTQNVKNHFRHLLSQLESNSNIICLNLNCLPESEKELLVNNWNNTDVHYPLDQCVHHLFEKQAQQTPDNIAIRYKGHSISYRSLLQQTNQVANFLHSKKIGHGNIVGICLPRSTLWPVCIFAIWKVGAIYLPLDSALPNKRLDFIISDSGADFVITCDDFIDKFETESRKLWSYEKELVEQQKTTFSKLEYSVDESAYIMYTSGTTGHPKGVIVNHRGLTNLPYCQFDRLEFPPGQRILQAVSFNFDASLHDITFALLSGGTLCIADENQRLPGDAMLQFLRQEKINFLTLPPSALNSLPLEELPDLHTVLAVGEVCNASLVKRWAGQKRFFNGYGPTETTVGALIGECFPDDKKPTIGTPLANIKIYILDEQMRPVPIGVTGEIYVGGVGVAQGYLNQPSKTNACFICNPFSDNQQSRLYKTGDKARFLQDGRVDFIGRIDQQIKIAGKRIEIEEIESQCELFDGIRSAAVITHESNSEQVLLFAYIVLDSVQNTRDDIVLIERLATHLSKNLPSYMLPSHYFLLNALPTSINGKLDRKLLESIDSKFKTLTTQINNKCHNATIFLSFKPVTNRISIPLCFYSNANHSLTPEKLASTCQQLATDYCRVFDYFEVGNLPFKNGILDIQSIPVPNKYQSQWRENEFIPYTESQKLLAQFWQQALDIDQIKLDDDFSMIGGDSLTAVKIIAMVEKETGIQLEGADFFAENFAYCAAKLESHLSGKPFRAPLKCGSTIPPPVSANFIESRQHQLYSVFHPSNLPAANRGVLICPPIGSDYQRSRPFLQQIATRLALMGFPTLRFDYFAVGDSSAASDQLTIEQCRFDIQSALNALIRQNRFESVSIIAVRFGASLVATMEPFNLVDDTLLIDPIINGKDFLQTQASLHRKLLSDSSRFQWTGHRKKPKNSSEYLGQYYNKQLRHELNALDLTSQFSITKSKTAFISTELQDQSLVESITANKPNCQLYQCDETLAWQHLDKLDSTITAAQVWHRIAVHFRGLG